jgi:hypothetical protein|nr:MAG TPA: hypothetical protein [Caudoviricetes sp.]
MSDKYILRSGAIDAIKRNSGTLYTREAEFLLRRAILLLKNAPAADVVEVVRCKDCDAWKRNVGIADSPNGHCFEHDIDTNGQDFCSWGATE